MHYVYNDKNRKYFKVNYRFNTKFENKDNGKYCWTSAKNTSKLSSIELVRSLMKQNYIIPLTLCE